MDDEYFDPDAEYERMRDEEGDLLEEDLRDVTVKFLNEREGKYYHERPEKLAEHILVTVESLLKVRFICDHPPFIRAVKREDDSLQKVLSKDWNLAPEKIKAQFDAEKK